MTNEEPPLPPHIPPKVRLHRSEKLGLPFLFILPALAVTGLFGPKTAVTEGRSGAVEWSAEYPSRLRYQASERLIVRVKNRSQSPLPELKLAFDPTYIHAFTAVAFDPAPDTPYVVNIQNLGPEQSRLVSVQLTAKEYGSRKGWVSLSAEGIRAHAELSTFIFP